MTLHPTLLRSLHGRRNIIFPDNRTQELLTNRISIDRVQHHPGGNRSLSTNVTGNPLPQPSNTGRRAPRQQTRDPITPSLLSLETQPVSQPSPAQTGHANPIDPGFPHLQLPQSGFNYTPVSGQGPMTIGNESGSYSVPPSIVVESHDRQHVLFPDPSSSQSGMRQLSSSALEAFNQHPFGIGQQRNNTQGQLLPELQLLILEEWDAKVIARVDTSISNSSVYKDALPRLLKRPDWEDFLCPWPPFHNTTFTTAGLNNSNSGKCIQLALRNRDDQVVAFPLAVVDREESHRAEIRGVDVVLCHDYFWKLAVQQNMPMSIERQTGGIGYSNTGHQWQIPGQSQNAVNPTETPVYGYGSPMWMQSGNRMEGVQIHPQQLAPSFQNTVSSTSQSGSAALVSSTTSPDGAFPATFSQNTYPNMPWNQPDKSGA